MASAVRCNVVRRRLRVARWMVVDEDQACGMDADRVAKKLCDANDRRRHVAHVDRPFRAARHSWCSTAGRAAPRAPAAPSAADNRSATSRGARTDHRALSASAITERRPISNAATSCAARAAPTPRTAGQLEYVGMAQLGEAAMPRQRAARGVADPAPHRIAQELQQRSAREHPMSASRSRGRSIMGSSATRWVTSGPRLLSSLNRCPRDIAPRPGQRSPPISPPSRPGSEMDITQRP